MADSARVEIDERDEAVIATIHGDVDLASVEAVGKSLTESLDHGHTRHVVDLTPTTFLDSVGIHLLFSVAEHLRMRRQQLRIVVPEKSSVARVLQLTDVGHVIPMHPDVESALAAPSEDYAF